MNYYIDFDNTLFNTPMLTQRMLNKIAEYVNKQKNVQILEECQSMFNNNIYDLAKYFCDKYNLDLNELIKNIDNLIFNCSDLIFDDSIHFLQKLRKENHNIFLLSYANDSLKYQTKKIIGSGIVNYFDSLFITTKKKFELDIDYKNGIFIDDNPDDLIGLYSKSPKKLIRLRRKENTKYSIYDLDKSDIEEYQDFNF